MRGKYYNGQSAMGIPVEIILSETHLSFVSMSELPGIREKISWEYKHIQSVGEPDKNQKFKVRNINVDDARLIFDYYPFLEEASKKISALNKIIHKRKGEGKKVALLVAATLLFVFVGGYFFIDVLPGVAITFVPQKWDQKLGNYVYDQIINERQICKGKSGAKALNRFAKKLAKKANSSFDFEIVIYDSPEINAFALPGGKIVLFRGLIDFAKSGNEVAGVLSHEMAHVLKRHGMEAIVRHMGLTTLISLLVGDAGGVTGLGAELGLGLISMSYGREKEVEADESGRQLLMKNNFNVYGFKSFFARLNEEMGGETGKKRKSSKGRKSAKQEKNEDEEKTDFHFPEMFSTHPSHESRTKFNVPKGYRGRNAFLKRQWKAIQTACGKRKSKKYRKKYKKRKPKVARK